MNFTSMFVVRVFVLALTENTWLVSFEHIHLAFFVHKEDKMSIQFPGIGHNDRSYFMDAHQSMLFSIQYRLSLSNHMFYFSLLLFSAIACGVWFMCTTFEANNHSSSIDRLHLVVFNLCLYSSVTECTSICFPSAQFHAVVAVVFPSSSSCFRFNVLSNLTSFKKHLNEHIHMRLSVWVSWEDSMHWNLSFASG